MASFQYIKLENIAKIKKGQILCRIKDSSNSDDTKKYRLLRESYIKKGYIEYGINLANSSINIATKDVNDSIKDNLSRVGDIVVRTKIPCNAVLIGEDDANKLVDAECFIIRNIDESIDKYYLLSYLNSDLFLENLKEIPESESGKLNVKDYIQINVPILSSRFEMEHIGQMYKEMILKRTIINKIITLEDEINNKRFLELVSVNDEFK